MEYSENMLSFDFTCPFCSKKYTVNKTWKHNVCRYVFSNDEGCCKHLLLWESAEIGAECSEEIANLEWLTRMSNLPFRVWDVMQEMINNDELPCEVRIRAFYVGANIVFVFGNNAKAHADAVLEKTKEYIREYKGDSEGFAEKCSLFNL